MLDDKPVSGITSSLVEAASLEGKPYRLYENSGSSFQGSNVLGTGFMLQEEEARELIHRDSRNKAVLFPFIGGEDINSRFDQSASRWIINFFDWPLSPETAPHGYEGPHASDFPDCLSIVETRVKPERDLLGLKDDASARGYAKYWWQYARKGIELYSTIKGFKKILAIAQVSRTAAFSFLPSDWVYSHKVVVFAFDCMEHFAVYQSCFHIEWAWNYSGPSNGT